MISADVPEITAYLAALDTRLALVGGRRRRRILAEVEDHLRQAVEDGVTAGLDRHTAAGAAIDRFGPPGAVAGRAVGRHWAVRAESWRRSHPGRATALFAGSCGVAAALSAGVAIGAGVFLLLLLARPVLDRARATRLEAGRSAPDRTPLEAGVMLAGAAAGSLLAALVAPAFVVATTAVTLPGIVIVLSGGRTPWQAKLRARRLQHPWAWGATWGGLAAATALTAALPLGTAIASALALTAMHGYQTVQAAADQVLRQPG